MRAEIENLKQGKNEAEGLLRRQICEKDDEIGKLRSEVEFFRKQSEYVVRKTQHNDADQLTTEEGQESETARLHSQLFEANEQLASQYRQI